MGSGMQSTIYVIVYGTISMLEAMKRQFYNMKNEVAVCTVVKKRKISMHQATEYQDESIQVKNSSIE